MKPGVRAGSATDVGRVRTLNEDAALVAPNLYAVADGMGGHQGGEVASALALETLRTTVHEGSADALIEGVQTANRTIFERQAADPDLAGMGTTLCAIALIEDGDNAGHITVVNVGDSRVYLFRDGDLTQLTVDHSLVEDLRREGRLTDEEAAIHPHRNILTRALGIEPEVEVDDFAVVPVAGDRYLLCSDGLFNEVSLDRIAATLRRLDDPDDVARELVRLANEGGGRDNITCVVVDVIDTDGGDPPVAVAPADPEDDVAGFTTAAPAAEAELAEPQTPEAATEVEAEETEQPAEEAEEDTAAPSRPRRFTWRVLLFVVIVLLVLAAAISAVGFYARHTYFVGVRDGEVIIYKGRPGGVLWFDPTVAEDTAVALDQMPVEYQDDLRSGVDEKSLDAARQYVARLRGIARQREQATTSTTTTTTTAPSSPRTTARANPGGAPTP